MSRLKDHRRKEHTAKIICPISGCIDGEPKTHCYLTYHIAAHHRALVVKKAGVYEGKGQYSNHVSTAAKRIAREFFNAAKSTDTDDDKVSVSATATPP